MQTTRRGGADGRSAGGFGEANHQHPPDGDEGGRGRGMLVVSAKPTTSTPDPAPADKNAELADGANRQCVRHRFSKQERVGTTCSCLCGTRCVPSLLLVCVCLFLPLFLPSGNGAAGRGVEGWGVPIGRPDPETTKTRRRRRSVEKWTTVGSPFFDRPPTSVRTKCGRGTVSRSTF